MKFSTMWYGKQASPASSTSTVDQDEIKFNDITTNNLVLINVYPISSATTTTTTIPSSTPLTITNTITKTTTNTLATPIHIPIPAPAPTLVQPPPNKTTISITSNLNSTTTTKITSAAAVGTTATTNKTSTSKSNSHSNSTGNKKCSPPKRPKLYHLPQQVAPWKSLQHHFLRHTDVKYKPEKRMTMAELGNEVLQRRNGWKVHHLVGQLSDLIQNEMQTREKISSLLEIFTSDGGKKVHELANNCHKLPEQYAALLQSQRSYGKNEFKPELIVSKLDDLLKGDLQRSNMFDDQLRDCRDLVVRITNEHRDRVARITTKFNKRIQL